MPIQNSPVLSLWEIAARVSPAMLGQTVTVYSSRFVRVSPQAKEPPGEVHRRLRLVHLRGGAGGLLLEDGRGEAAAGGP